MKLDETYQPEYESLKELLIEMASERSVDVLLRMIVRKMTQRPHIALIRIWLKKQGDQCDTCAKAAFCPRHADCLHLVASGGHSIAVPLIDWTDLNRHGQRIPLGYNGIGHIALTGRALSPSEVERDPDWQERDLWAPGEQITGFGSQPLVYKDEVLGVIAIYSRIDAARVKEGKFWLRMIAHHMASAIANAKAFSEIDHLKSQLELENAYLREEINHAHSFGSIIGQSPSLITILNQIELVAPTDASVFVFGESGTGKELVAREIHKRSLRKNKPMIKVNCATIPGELYESEFFGHVRGAFTGAVKDRAGRFQAADSGTLFLDEVGELPISLQGKLLRVLQEGTYERIGEDNTRHVDVRIIAATNRDIKNDITEGRFRKDLYYRLNVFPIEIPPLRKRREDIQPLVFHFLDKILSDMKLGPKKISSAGMNRLVTYPWPGNVRELRNVIERSVITSKQDMLHFEFLEKEEHFMSGFKKNHQLPLMTADVQTDIQIHQMMKQNIQNGLKACKGRIYGPKGAAALMGIAPTTLCSRLKKYKIDPALFRQLSE